MRNAADSAGFDVTSAQTLSVRVPCAKEETCVDRACPRSQESKSGVRTSRVSFPRAPTRPARFHIYIYIFKRGFLSRRSVKQRVYTKVVHKNSTEHYLPDFIAPDGTAALAVSV